MPPLRGKAAAAYHTCGGRLQPHATVAEAPCDRGCNPMQLRQRPHVIEAAPLYQGALANALASFAGNYPWFLTFNSLNEALPLAPDGDAAGPTRRPGGAAAPCFHPGPPGAGSPGSWLRCALGDKPPSRSGPSGRLRCGGARPGNTRRLCGFPTPRRPTRQVATHGAAGCVCRVREPAWQHTHPLAAPELGPCASSGRARRHGAARHS